MTMATMKNHDVTSSHSRSPLRSWAFAIHATVVAVLLALFTTLTLMTPPDAGANIGAGIVGLPLLALGLPWTVPVFWDPYQLDTLPTAVGYLVKLGPAVLNVALHAAFRSAFARRRR